MNSAAFSIQVSLAFHVGAFLVALALSAFTTSMPHYHVRQGAPIVLHASFASAEPTSDAPLDITLPAEPSQSDSLLTPVEELAPALLDVRPVRTSIESSLARVELPADKEDCKCEAAEHEIQTPKRSVEATPQLVVTLDTPSQPRRRDLTDPAIEVSTEVSIPQIPESSGTDVDVLPRKLATNLPPPYPPVAFQQGHQGRVILEVRVSTQGAVVSVRVVESSGYEALDQAALTAVAAWQFEPGYRFGQPVEAVVSVPVRFAIRS